MPDGQQHNELTVNEVQQIGSILIPQMREALREEFGTLHARIDDLESRVIVLESLKNKVTRYWTAATAVVTFIATTCGSWLAEHAGKRFK